MTTTNQSQPQAEVNPGQMYRSIIGDEAIARGMAIDHVEEAALAGLLEGVEPVDDFDASLRFSITGARGLERAGMPVDERAVALNVLYRGIVARLSLPVPRK